ncbi:MAG: 4Fe-4S binding protein [Conexivisphaera sp.]
MELDELLWHICAKLGKLSGFEIPASGRRSILEGPISRRDLITGLAKGFQAPLDLPMILEDACEAKFGCRRCVDACPEGALEIYHAVGSPTPGYRLSLDSSKCTRCGLCAGVCPVGAVQMPSLPERAFIGLLEGMNRMRAERRILVLISGDPGSVRRIPWVHVERIDDLRMVGVRWLAMALASIDLLVMKGVVDARLSRAIEIMSSSTGRIELVGIDGDVESAVMRHASGTGAPGRIEPSAYDPWSSYVSSLRVILPEGSGAEGLGMRDLHVSDTCTMCGACASKCPHGALRISADQGESGALVFDPSLCTGCGLCVGVCPEGSISMEEQGVLNLRAHMVYEDELIRCARCGRPIYTRKFYERMVAKLGREDPMMMYCSECKQRMIYERMFGVGGAQAGDPPRGKGRNRE